MTQSQKRLIEIGGWLVAVLLPLYFNPFTFPVFEPGKITLFRLIVLTMTAVVLFSFFYNRKTHSTPASTSLKDSLNQIWRQNPLVAACGAYVVIYLTATILSVDTTRSWSGFYGMITILSTIVFFLMMSYTLQTEAMVDRCISAILLGSVPIAIYGWVQYLGLDALPWYTKSISPVHSTLERSLFLGSYLALIIPFTLARIISQKQVSLRQSASYWCLFLLQVSCLLLTLARGAWLAFLVGTFFFLLLVAFRLRNLRLSLGAFLFFVLGIGVLVLMNTSQIIPQPLQNLAAPERTFNYVPESAITQVRAASIADRLLIWRHSLTLFQERWLLGYGPETFHSVFLSRYPMVDEYSYQKFAFDPHNLVLNQLMAAGILGLVAFIWIVTRFYMLMFQSLQKSIERETQTTVAAIIGSVTAFLVQGLFNPIVIVLWALFWLTLASGISLIRRQID